jgi:hypothetical protein
LQTWILDSTLDHGHASETPQRSKSARQVNCGRAKGEVEEAPLVPQEERIGTPGGLKDGHARDQEIAAEKVGVIADKAACSRCENIMSRLSNFAFPTRGRNIIVD